MIRLVIVDDQALVREGLALILGAQPDVDVVGELADGQALLDLFAADQDPADVVLLDLYLPGMDGVRALSLLRGAHPETRARVLMLTAVGRAADIQRALAAGADGFVLKDASGGELAAAVRAAHGGVTALSSSAVDMLWPKQRPAAVPPAGAGVSTLTRREREILGLIAQGMANQDIAGALTLAERTVKTHVSNILAKLQVSSRTQAALLARDLLSQS
ncbi:response regulator [Nonomuraea sp. NPDC004354]